MKFKLGFQEMVAVIVCLIVVMSLVFVMVLWRPASAKLGSVHKSQQEEQEAQQSHRLTLERLKESRNEAAQVESALLSLSERMPKDPALPSLLVELGRLAGVSGVTVSQFRPGRPAPDAGYDIVPLEFSVRGSFNAATSNGGSILEFFYRLENFKREIKVDNMTVSREGEDGNLLIDVKAVTFVLSAIAPAAETTTTPAQTATGQDGQSPASMVTIGR